MKMKQADIIKAYNAAEGIAETAKLNDMELWRIYRLRKALLPHIEFGQERDTAIRQKYTPYADEKGMISGETYKAFLAEMNALGELEVDVEAERFPLRVAEGMTIAQMEALDPFVEFTEPAE